VVDRAVVAHKVAAIRDAVARIRRVLPSTADAFVSDRTTREVVTFNLFLALQEAMSLAAHWLADGNTDRSYRHVRVDPRRCGPQPASARTTRSA
jgi:uncharacterized protein YutE (UPF0331/DUF86 family)